jgi:hypothetical protein
MWPLSSSPKNLSESIAAVCAAVRTYRDFRTWRWSLFGSTGHRKFRDGITEAALAAELRTKPDLILDWLQYSRDKRSSPAWYFDEKGTGCWVVGYFHEDPRSVWKVPIPMPRSLAQASF